MSPARPTAAAAAPAGRDRPIVKMLPPPNTLKMRIPSYPLASPSSSDDEAAKILHDALTIRHRIFVVEQGCAATNEIDDEDGRSWHWVACAGVSGGEEGGELEAQACLRLIPPPQPPHPNQIDSSNKSTGQATNPASDFKAEKETTKEGEQREEEEDRYIKLGRLAVLPHARHKGLARLLCNEALNWALENTDTVLGNNNNEDNKDNKDADTRRNETKTKPPNILVHAQIQVQDLWRRLGFTVDPALGEWDEEGIRHVGMWRSL